MQPWKVLIADDELIIREGIRDSVVWSELMLKVVAEAEDGEEALELALKHQVHIMLVDLNMPMMNGLTLMRHIRKQLPECRIVIISGHDEFAYAQEAIRLNVDDYMMKPVNREQLHSVLERVRQQLERSQQQKRHREITSKQIQRNFSLLRERFCNDWIEGNVTEEEVAEQLPFLQLPLKAPDLLGVIRCPEMNASQPMMKENDRQLTFFAVENIAADIFQAYQRVVFQDHAGFIIVMLWDTENSTGDAFVGIEQAVQMYLKVIVLSHYELLPPDGSLDISGAYNRCKAVVTDKTEVCQLVRRAEQYIYEHYCDRELSLDTIARELHVSPVYLSRLIKKELDISFVTMLTQIRIKKAIELLNTTNWTINEIADQVGYDTQHYFSTAFKKVVGVSPKQYRNGLAFAKK